MCDMTHTHVLLHMCDMTRTYVLRHMCDITHTCVMLQFCYRTSSELENTVLEINHVTNVSTVLSETTASDRVSRY